MPTDVSGNNTFYLTQNVVVANKKTVPIYGSVGDADNYFYAHINYSDWADATKEDKWRCLATATRLIDRLNFVGQKADADQALQFPRSGATKVPIAIEQACYELALKLHMGLDPDTEARQLSVRLQGYGGSRTDYDRTFVPDYVRAGIPSQVAWNLLYPYLRDPNALSVVRSS
jgi:hypothetical protein